MSADAQSQCSCVFCFVFLSNAVPDQLPVTPVGSFDKDTQPLNKSIEMVRIYFFLWIIFLKIQISIFLLINLQYFLIFSEEKSYIFQKGIIYQDWSRSSYLNSMSKSLQLWGVTLYIIKNIKLVKFRCLFCHIVWLCRYLESWDIAENVKYVMFHKTTIL